MKDVFYFAAEIDKLPSQRKRGRAPNREREEAVRLFIDRYWKKHYSAPTIREICVGVGISSTSVAVLFVKRIGGVVPTWVKVAIDRAL